MASRLTQWLLQLAVAVAAAVLVALVIARFIGVDVTIADTVVTVERLDRMEFPVPGPDTIRHPDGAGSPAAPATDDRPRNVILIIGDGMGLGHLSTAATLLSGPAGGLAVESAPVTGLVRTWTASGLVTDSAAAGTALATGHKTAKRFLSTLPDGSEPMTLFDAATSRGMATGVVTTSGLADATPSAFLAHSSSRYTYAAILEQILRSDSDVLVGGTFERHRKAGNQPDYLELLGRAEEVADGHRTVVRSGEQLAVADPPVVALFPPRPGSRYAHGPPLERSVRRALELLAPSPAGFLLVIESEETDESAHENDIRHLLAGIEELESTVRHTLDFAAAHGATLVLVTADHETAGVAISDGDFEGGVAELRWANNDHLGNWVPLFAFGPGASRFSGVLDNTSIPVRIAELLGFEEFPSPL